MHLVVVMLVRFALWGICLCKYAQGVDFLFHLIYYVDFIGIAISK